MADVILRAFVSYARLIFYPLKDVVFLKLMNDL
jgi:hypothetical protein